MVDVNILALDTATTTGVCILTDKILRTETWDFSKLKEQGSVHSKFSEKLVHIIDEYDIDLIVKEKGFFSFSKGRAAKFLFGFHNIVEMVGYDMGVRVEEVAASTIKKYMTGNGRADKSEVMAAVRDLGYNPRNDHEADAIAVMLYGVDNYV